MGVNFSLRMSGILLHFLLALKVREAHVLAHCVTTIYIHSEEKGFVKAALEPLSRLKKVVQLVNGVRACRKRDKFIIIN